MSNSHNHPGTTGLTLEESLIFELSSPGRIAFSLPCNDIPETQEPDMIPRELIRDTIDGFPQLSEVDVARHFTRLSTWNYSVDHGMYPLGSCTMKYNPKSNELAAALPGFQNLHPHTPVESAQGALQLMYELQEYLREITGFDAVSLQPSAGAQGELCGMLMIKAYHLSRGDAQRTVVLIPDSAHGTNPASAVVAGLEAVTVASGPDGCLDPAELEPHLNDKLAAIMMTNPNTLGIFERHACDVACKIKMSGGLVYMDGANLNALMGIAKPGNLGVDVMHFNLHKTFSTPHGGGGPGSGPVAVSKDLEPFLPVPRIVKTDSGYSLAADYPESIGKLHNFFGNFGVMVKAYNYIRTLGPDGIREVTESAVLNANYIRTRLKDYYNLPYPQICKHECVFNDTLQQTHGVTTMDIAKRLIDYGYHPPTVYFPLIVKGAIMIEPTETESKETMDRYIEAMIAIAKEAETDPETVKAAPVRAKRQRLDETLAARKPVLRWTPDME